VTDTKFFLELFAPFVGRQLKKLIVQTPEEYRHLPKEYQALRLDLSPYLQLQSLVIDFAQRRFTKYEVPKVLFHASKEEVRRRHFRKSW